MSSTNQKTLFQTWGSAVPKATLLGKDLGKKLPQRRRANTNSQVKAKKKENDNATPLLWAEVGQGTAGQQASTRQEQEMDEVDDDLILVAVYEAEKSLENQSDLSTDASIKDSAQVCSDLPDFDSSSGRTWIYPINFPIRDYQLKISEAALFQNTLVCLPTGLGKTFIASVVMYNFYRWYPAGTIVFLAPTKPLVAQQIEACYRVMGIPQQHMAELTGSTPAPQRRELWRSRRIFFLTPQVMVNDLSRNTCPAPQIKCVVIDEAHKASGNHAYCQVVRELWNQTKQFRVLALSATPGADMKAVQQVISNLLISHIELRSEESPDVQAHSHQRSVDKIVVPLGESLTGYQSRYLQVLERFTSRLTQMGVLNQRDIRSLTKYQVILARDQFRRNPPSHLMGAQHGALEGDFALCISLYHGYELLQQMGLRSLFLFTQNIMSGAKETARARNELQRNPVFMDLYREMEAMFLSTTKSPEEQYFYSHPKLQKLDEVIQEHFRTWVKTSGSAPDSVDKPESTRVMIFSSFRESVQEIAEMLNRHHPLVRVMTFMGQASAGKGVRGFTQKEQLEVVRRFREGGFNTLVSTCVGEEGLDIGEVDLIVCFDAQKSPIRLVQRMGRTGRHRQGRIVVILAEGREERIYNQSQSNRRSVNKRIMGSKQSFSMFPYSPRMLPTGVTPTLLKMHITCGQFEGKESSRRSSNGRQSLSMRRVSLLNPDAQVDGVQGRVKEDGFLTPAEEAEWSSTMKLGENEAQPRLRHSSFLCFNTEPQQQDECVKGPVRDLSLWEWRHWQNQPLPTHRVDHSSRCLHFTAIMELIDQMRQEEEKSGCRYESEVKAYLQKEDVVGCEEDGKKAKPTCEKNPRQKRSKPRLVGRDASHSVSKTNLDKKDQARPSSWTLLKDKVSSESDCDATKENLSVFRCDDNLANNDADNDNTDNAMQTDLKEHSETILSSKDKQLHSSPEHTKGLKTSPDTSLKPVEEMFYLPKWDVCQKLYNFSQSAGSLEIILSNVKHLLSRSPPECLDLHCSLSLNEPAHFGESDEICSSPREEVDHFQVNFDLDEHDNSLDSDSLDCNIAGAPPESVMLPSETVPAGPDSTANSPSWDEVFDDAVDDRAHKNTNLPVESKIQLTSLDESVDLFGDDEAFLQISLPNIETPNKNTVIPVNRQATDQRKQVTQNVGGASNIVTTEESSKSPVHKPPSEQRSEAFNYSQDIFSVNFDLGFSFDSEEEETAEPASDMTAEPTADRAQTFTSLTLNKPNTSSNNFSLGHMSTPRVCPMDKKLPSLIDKTNLSPIITERESLGRPNASTPNPSFVSPKSRNLELLPKVLHSQAQPRGTGNRLCRRSLLDAGKPVYGAHAFTETAISDSDEESVIRKPGRQGRPNPLASPDQSKISDVESPVQAPRKRVARLNMSEESDGEAVSDDDFKQDSFCRPKVFQPSKRSHPLKVKSKAVHRDGRQFLDEEAELSEEGGSVSSDECDGEELNKSLEGFVVDATQFSQGLNDSEMHGVYLKSVKSPAISNKFRMAHRPVHNMNIFSQVPEQDETYEEDSFVVNESEVEEDSDSASDEEEEAGVEIVPEDSYIDGRRQYATRRRVHLRQTRTAGETRSLHYRKAKRSRLVRVEDSSEEEEEKDEKKRKMLYAVKAPVSDGAARTVFNTSPLSHLPKSDPIRAREEKKSRKDAVLEKQERDRQRFSNQALLSEELDFQEPLSTSCVKTQAACSTTSLTVASGSVDYGTTTNNTTTNNTTTNTTPACVCVLVDSRCISAGADVVSSLRLKHGAAVHICSLVSCDFIVSNRMAVEWQRESDLASPQSRKRLQERMQSLQGLFDRVCLLVEKDRTKAGEPLRSFQRSRYYDSTLAALVRAGVRLLFSTGPDDTATLLAQLAQVEQRKGQAISVPVEVKGRRQQALQFYLTLPCVSYVNALYMCNRFYSVAHLVNSSVDTLQAGIHVSRSRAEEIYRCLRYSCDTTLMKSNTSKNNL
ncbi:Fanconi anemia group M protein isoform X2 [Pangasianodon hypophthalmus]|uniref:Fanconi anemia group M protein isoform X2 n=1 Tax=Pangasianodon hypophthalmus TaxID=310915 RepID=UPI0023071C10|nr:Fanconi anemia group M protein isoform X2 [Pangasianodon hypophthalmus]